MEKISTKLINFDLSKQPRYAEDNDAIARYSEKMNSGLWKWELSPVDLFFNGEEYYISCGFHRCKAADRSIKYVMANVHLGDEIDALKFAVFNEGNSNNGVPETRKDLINRIDCYFELFGVGDKSVRAIAEDLGVPGSFMSVQNRRAIFEKIEKLKLYFGEEIELYYDKRQVTIKPESISKSGGQYYLNTKYPVSALSFQPIEKRKSKKRETRQQYDLLPILHKVDWLLQEYYQKSVYTESDRRDFEAKIKQILSEEL